MQEVKIAGRKSRKLGGEKLKMVSKTSCRKWRDQWKGRKTRIDAS